MFDVLQILSNTIKHDQTRSNKISKVETVWSPNNVWLCLLAKHFPFGWELRGMTISQNFPRTLSHVTQTFRTKQINKNRFWLIWLPRALIIRNIMRGVIEEIQFKWLRYFNARVVFWSNILQFTSYDCNTFGTRFILQLYQCRSKLTGLILGQGNGDQFDIAGSSKYPMINGWKNKGKSEGLSTQ